MKQSKRPLQRRKDRRNNKLGRSKFRRHGRCFATHLERLEERTLLAGNVLASLDSDIFAPGDTTQVALTISGSTPAVVGFRMQAGDVGNLDPAAPLVSTSSGSPITPLLTRHDLAGGAESLVLAQLAPGQYIITAAGEHGTFGDFDLDVFMPGDMDGSGTVTDFENAYCTAAVTQTMGTGNFVTALLFKQQGIDVSKNLYCVEMDANLDGKIDGTDMKYVQMNTNRPRVLMKVIADSDPPVIDAGLLDDTGSSDSDGITNSATIIGSVTDSSQITAFRAGFDGMAPGDYVDISAALDASGNFQLDQATLESIAGGNLANSGTRTLYLMAGDQHGNLTHTPFAVTFELDTIAPDAPTGLSLDPASDLGISDTDNLTADNEPILLAESEGGALVELFSDIHGWVGSRIATSAVAITSTPLDDGVHQITARATDVAGNVGVFSAPLQIEIETVPPSSLTMDLAAASDTGTLGDQYTETLIVTFEGTTDPGLEVVLTNTGVTTTADPTTGQFSFSNVELPFGENEFTVTATDAAGNVKTFTRSFSRNNDPTEGAPLDDFSVNEDSSYSIIPLQFLFEDVNLTEGDWLTYSVVANDNPDLLTADVSGDNLQLVYADELNGTATITIRATDSLGKTADSQFTIHVLSVNDEPVLTTPFDDINLDEGAADTVIDLAGLFTDADIDTNADSLTITIADNTNAALVGANISGDTLTLSYPAHEHGTSDITIRATDLSGAFVEDTFTVTINSIEDTPIVVTPITNVIVGEDAPDQVIDISGTFDDADIATDGDSLTITVAENTAPGLVSAVLAGDQLTLSFADNQAGNAEITIRATDTTGKFAETTFNVAVGAANDGPFVDNPVVDFSVDEDAADTVIDLLSVFDDVDILTAGDVLTMTVTANTNSALVGTDIQGSELTLSYLANQHGSAEVTVRATDINGAWVEDTFTATVNPVNDTPTVENPIADTAVDEDAADQVIDISGVFDDADIATDGDILTLTVAGNDNPSLVGAAIVGGDLTLSFAENQNGTADITIRATDLAGAWVEETFTVTVTPTNDPPTVETPIADVTVDEDAADTVIDLSGVFADMDTADGDNLTFSIGGNTNSGLVGASISGDQLTLSYAANQNGMADISVTATDSSGEAISSSFTVTVDAVNDQPTVENAIGDVAVDEDADDTHIDLTGVFGDVDILTDGDSLTLSVSDNTNTGLVSTSLVGSTLTLSYAGDQNGEAEITVLATDSGGKSISSTFTVTVTAVNDEPTVENTIADVTVGEDVGDTIIDLSGIFGDVDIATNGDSFTFSVSGNTNAGLVGTSISGDQLTLSYAADQHGTADISVIATDSGGESIGTTFTVTVAPVNDGPTVENPIADVTVDEDAPDTIIDISDVFGDVDIVTDGDSLSLSISGNTKTSLVDASISGSQLTLSYLANQHGTADITVTATDLAGSPISSTFTVTVNPQNDQPQVFNGVADLQRLEDAADSQLNLGGVFGDFDIATAGDSLTYSVVGNSNPSLVSTSISGEVLTLSYAADQNGSAEITVRATDEAGLFAEDTFTVTLAPQADDPVADDDTYASVSNELETELDVLNNDSDPDLGDSFTIIGVTQGSRGGIVTINPGDLSLSYMPSSEVGGLYGLDGQTERFTYTIEDSTGRTSTAEVEVTVRDNQAPELTDDTETVAEDSPTTTISVLANDSDPEGDDFSITSVTQGSHGGTVAINGDAIDYTPADNFQGQETFTYTVTDTALGTSTATVTVTVDPENDGPTVELSISAVTVDEDAADKPLDLSAIFGDADLAYGDSLTLSVTANSNSTVVGTSISGSDLTLSFLENQNGTANITVRATDLAGAWVEETFTVTVNAQNDDPTVENAIEDVVVNEDAADTTITLNDIFGDVDIATNGDTLVYTVTGNTNAALVGTDISSGTLTLSYADDQHGTADITITATDSAGKSVSDTFTVTVNSQNDPPTAENPLGDVTVDEDAADTVIDLSTLFDDVDIATDGDSLALTVSGNTNSGLVTASILGSQLTLSYAAGQSGTANITVKGTDLAGSFVEDTFTVTVNSANHAPQIVSGREIDDITVNDVDDPAPQYIELSTRFSDSDGDNLTFTVANDNTDLVTVRLGNWDGSTFTADPSGTFLEVAFADYQSRQNRTPATVTVTATDDGLGTLSVDDEFTVTVNPEFTIEVELVMLDAPTPTQQGGGLELGSLPTSLDEIAVGNTYILEVWARDLLTDAATDGPFSEGLASIFVDIGFDTAFMQVNESGLHHDFDTISGGTVDNTTGLVDDFGGHTLTANLGVGQYVRIGYLEIQATAATAPGTPHTFTVTTGVDDISRTSSDPSVTGTVDGSQINLVDLSVRHADATQFNVVANESVLVISGMLDGIAFDAQEVTVSDTTEAGGSIYASVDDFENPTIINIVRASIDLADSGQWTPLDFGGGTAGEVDFANYGLTTNILVSAPDTYGDLQLAIRDLIIDITTNGDLAVDPTTGAFDTDSQDWEISQGFADRHVVLEDDSITDAARDQLADGELLNHSTADSTFEETAQDVYRITLPVDRRLDYPTAAGFITIDIVGQVVAEYSAAALNGTQVAAGEGSPLVTESDANIGAVLEQAVETWQDALGTEQPVDITLVTEDLGGSQLGEGRITELDERGIPSAGIVTIDDDAAGMGWYLGAGDDVPADKYDLYTVLLHEVGHVLGFTQAYIGFQDMLQTDVDGSVAFVGAGITATLSDDAQHLAAGVYADELMDSLLEPGERELPSRLDVQILQAVYEEVEAETAGFLDSTAALHAAFEYLGDTEDGTDDGPTTLEELDAAFENWDTPLS